MPLGHPEFVHIEKLQRRQIKRKLKNAATEVKT